MKRLAAEGRASFAQIVARYGDRRAAKAARREGDAAADELLRHYDDIKRRLPAEMPAGIFSGAEETSLQTHSGIALIDFDGLPSESDAAAIRDMLGERPEVSSAWITLSGYGAQAHVRITPNPQSVAEESLMPIHAVAALHRDGAYPAVMAWAKREFGEWLSARGLDVDHPQKELRPIDAQCGTLPHKSAVAHDPGIRADHLDGADAIAWDAAAAVRALQAQEAPPPKPPLDRARLARDDYLRALGAIPVPQSYDDWNRILLAAKAAGLSADDVERWSAGGAAYKPGEVRRKWDIFDKRESGARVGAGTLIDTARRHGYRTPGEERRGRGRPSDAYRAQAFAAQAAEHGIEDAAHLAPHLTSQAEYARLLRYEKRRLLLVKGKDDFTAIQICDDLGFWHAVSGDRRSLSIVALILGGARDKAAADLRAIGGEWADGCADRLTDKVLQPRTLDDVIRLTQHNDKLKEYPEISDSEFNQRRTGYLPIDGGIWDLRRDTLMTDYDKIKAMYQSAPAAPIPSPDYSLLDDPATLGGRIMRQAIKTHFGEPLLRRMSIGLIGVGKFAFVIKSQKDAGKTTFMLLLRRALPGVDDFIGSNEAGRNFRFDTLAQSLSRNVFSYVDEAHTSKTEKAVFDSTLPNLKVERKRVDPYYPPRKGALVMGTTEDFVDVDYERGGLMERIGEISQFVNPDVVLPAEWRSPLYSQPSVNDAADYLRAYLFREAGRVIREHGALPDGSLDMIDIDACERRTRTQAGVAALNAMAARAEPHIRALRAEYEPARGAWTAQSDLYDLLAANGVSEKSVSPEIGRMIRRAFGDNVRSTKKRIGANVNAVKAWEVRRIDGAEAWTADASALNSARDWIGADGGYTDSAQDLIARAADSGYEWQTQPDGTGRFVRSE